MEAEGSSSTGRLVISFIEPGADESDLRSLARSVSHGLNSETRARASIAEAEGGAGSKGGGELSQVVLEISMHAAAVVVGYTTKDILFEVAKHLKTYFDRRPKLKMEITLPDGRNLEIEGKHVRPETVEQTALQLKDMLEAMP